MYTPQSASWKPLLEENSVTSETCVDEVASSHLLQDRKLARAMDKYASIFIVLTIIQSE